MSMIISIVLISLLALSAVSAADDFAAADDADLAAVDEVQTIEDHANEETNLESNDITADAADDSEDSVVSDDASKSNALGANPLAAGGSLADLRQAINNSGDTLVLDGDYVYVRGDPTSGITISKNITIDGQGHNIDGGNSASIFNIPAECTVVLKNIFFINGKQTTGGSIFNMGELEIIDCYFYNNTANKPTFSSGGLGGAIYNDEGADLTILGGGFVENTADRRGGAIYNLGEMDLTLVEFSNNQANGGLAASAYGGAIYNVGLATIDESSFTSNTASGGITHVGHGGAIYNDGSLSVDNSSFTSNSANRGITFSGDGGAIYNTNNADALVTETQFTSNVASRYGGAIYSEGELTVDGGDFDSNHVEGGLLDSSKGRGGAIYTDGEAEVFDSYFAGNGADEGTAIYNNDVLLLQNNLVEETGVAIHSAKNTDLNGDLQVVIFNGEDQGTTTGSILLYGVLTDENENLIYDEDFAFVIGGTIIPYTAFDNLTGIYTAPHTFARIGTYEVSANYDKSGITTAKVYYNTTLIALQALIDAAEDGAVINLENDYRYFEQFDASLKDTGVVVNKSVTINGDGATISGSDECRIFKVERGPTLTLNDLNLVDGSAIDVGGAIHSIGNVIINNCLIANNVAGNDEYAVKGAGAIFAMGQLIVSDSQFLNNTCIGEGGAVYLIEALSSFENVVFVDNGADLGGAIAIYDSLVAITNSTFSDNFAEDLTYNIYQEEGNYIFMDKTNFFGIYPTVEFEDQYIYGNEIIINGTFDWGVNNSPIEMTYFINGNEFTTDVNNGNFSILIDTQPDVGVYTFAIVSFIDEDGNYYEVDPIIKAFEVVKATPVIVVAGSEVEYGETSTVNVKVTDENGDPVTGTVIVCVDWDVDAVYDVVSLDEDGKGEANFRLDLMGNGAYTYRATATFIADDYYNSVNGTAPVIVKLPHDISFDISIQNITYGDDLKIVVTNVHDLAGTLLSGIIIGSYTNEDGEAVFYEFNVTDGEGTGIISGLAAGPYDIAAKFTDEGEFYSETEYLSFGVEQADSVVQVVVQDGEIIIFLGGNDERLNETVKVFFDQEQEEFTEVVTENGTASLEIPSSLKGGNHLVEVTFIGNENYYASNDYAEFSLPGSNLILTVIECAAGDVSYGEDVIIFFHLTDESFNRLNTTINVTVGEKDYGEIEIVDGDGNLTVSNLSADTYMVEAKYAGNGVYAPSNAADYFKVNKNATKIIYEDMETIAIDYYNDGRVGEYFKWRLVDANGNPIANTPMQIGFNGVVYDEKDGIVTDADGYAQLQINLARKDLYTFAVCWLGDENHNGSFVVAKINVDTQTPNIAVPNKSYKATAKTKTLTATFKSNRGTVIANKKITFTVNGKTYSAKTNDKGVASVNVSITAKGSYAVTAKFAGDSTYSAVTKKATLKLT